MYLRTIKRKNKDGSVVEYVQLAHNVRHPVKGYPKAEVIHSFGRREQLDVEGLKRLVSSISRFIKLDETKAASPARSGASAMAFVRSLPVGGILVLHALWERFGIHGCLQKTLAPQSFPVPIQHALFALVAKRALAPFACGLTTQQIASACFLSGQQRVSLEDRHFDQVLEMLQGHAGAVQQKVFLSIASHLNIDVGLVFVHLISTRIINKWGGSAIQRPEPWGLHHYDDASNDNTLCLAVSQTGIPIGCWLMPGNQINSSGLQAVEENLSQWSPGRVVWVMDRLTTADAYQDALQQGGFAYIMGQKLSDCAVTEETRTPKGRFKILGPDLQIKTQIENRSALSRQRVIAYHPGQAAIDRKVRQRHLLRLRRQLEKWNRNKILDKAATPELLHGLARYLKMPKGGAPKIDGVRVRQDEKQDGKYLIMSNESRLTPETLAWGHKQLIDLDQIYRGLMPGIQSSWASSSDDLSDAGMLLAWLVLLFRRVVELQTGMPWKNLCRDMQALHLGEFADGNHRIFKYTELTASQKKILQHLCIDLPDLDHRFDPSA